MKRLTRKEKEQKVMDECMAEMFKRVGEKYPNPELTSNSEWYRMRSWTEREEKLFFKWMVDYLRKNLKATKKRAILVTSFFNLEYGWTTVKKKQEKRIMVIRQ